MESFQELHFMNAARFEEGKFSFAVDSFLELWLKKLFYRKWSHQIIKFHINSIRRLREQCRMLGSSSVNSHIQNTAFNLLIMQDDILSYVIRKCPSFVRMGFNTQFSETFRTNVFSDLSSDEKGETITDYTQNCVEFQRDLCEMWSFCLLYLLVTGFAIRLFNITLSIIFPPTRFTIRLLNKWVVHVCYRSCDHMLCSVPAREFVMSHLQELI